MHFQVNLLIFPICFLFLYCWPRQGKTLYISSNYCTRRRLITLSVDAHPECFFPPPPPAQPWQGFIHVHRCNCSTQGKEERKLQWSGAFSSSRRGLLKQIPCKEANKIRMLDKWPSLITKTIKETLWSTEPFVAQDSGATVSRVQGGGHSLGKPSGLLRAPS